MRLCKGRGNYKLKTRIGQFVCALLDVGEGRALHVLQVTSMEEVVSKRVVFPGPAQPKLLAISHDGKEVYLWPVPDRAAGLILRYYPPIVEV